MKSNRTKAQYASFCLRCCGPIHGDEWIRNVGGAWVHDVCPKHDNEFAPAGKGQCHRRNTMLEQYVTIEQYRRLVKHVNELTANFNTINQEVEQLKQEVSALKSQKQAKKTGFTGRSAELEAEVADLSVSDTPEIDTTAVASKLAKVLAKGNAQ